MAQKPFWYKSPPTYQALKSSGRLNMTILLAVSSLFCFGMSLIRYRFTHELLYLFLNWNLFLAFLPWAASTFLILRKQLHWTAGIFLGITWLLFFPNAPYILTDLIHLRPHGNGHLWFDLIVIFSFAWTGLLFGFVSLSDMEELAARRIKKPIVNLLTIPLLFLAAFGIYLGRYGRFNSWDVWSDPSGITYEIGHRMVHPWQHPRTWGMTLFLGVLLNMMYLAFRFFSEKRKTLEA